ncbi:MAG: PH domain-containing protein [Candidatus Nanopelagicales bacterium]
MGYPTKLLGEGEIIEFEMKPHWRALILPVLWLLLTVFIGVWLYISLGSWSWSAGGVVETVGRGAIVVAGAFILVLWVIRPFLYWLTTQYVFTNRRIITRAGVVSKKGRDMPLAKVNNVSFEIGVLGRILNYGRLEVTSASDENLVIDDVPNVEVIQRDVYRLHEQDDDRRRQRSSEQGGDPVPPGDGT